jgi:hypothetical protein
MGDADATSTAPLILSALMLMHPLVEINPVAEVL